MRLAQLARSAGLPVRLRWGVRAHCAAIPARHRVPRYVWFVDEPLLRTVSGKFLKR